MNPNLLSLAADHLWQSTIFAVAAAVIALALRRQRAQVRYWIWLAASIKFLVPFAALVAVGGALSWRTIEIIPYDASGALVETISQPFTRTQVTVRAVDAKPGASGSLLPALQSLAIPIWAAGSGVFLLIWAARWWRLRQTLARATSMARGREAEMLDRLAAARAMRSLPMYATDTTVEPGVFGVLRPVLLWPRGISEHLADEQIEAILAHELTHLRRQDNLAAALHMAVQALFWFHPLVWWIGRRLVHERELACDDEVIRLGSEREVYAESILKTCKFFLESPLVCVSGVTGSDLKKRIEQIMTHDTVPALPFWRQALLAVAGVVVFATPVVLGALNPPPQTRELPSPAALPAFEEVSIRPNPSAGRGGRGGQMQPGRFVGQNLTLQTIVRRAYAPDRGPYTMDLFEAQVAGGPDWLNVDKYDIVATTAGPTEPGQMRLMLQRMLAERFKIAAHWETRELPVYSLVRVRPEGGLIPISAEECEKYKPAQPGPFPPGQQPCGSIQFAPGTLIARGVPMEWLANALANVPVISGIDRMVLDRTGIEGNFGFELEFSPAAGSGAPAQERPELFTALQEQLGLKLEAIRAPIDVLVIDRAERPDAN